MSNHEQGPFTPLPANTQGEKKIDPNSPDFREAVNAALKELTNPEKYGSSTQDSEDAPKQE